MQSFQQRVVDEKRELDERLSKLSAFWDNPLFQKLPEAERERLERQWRIMTEYSHILGERIAAFTLE